MINKWYKEEEFASVYINSGDVSYSSFTGLMIKVGLRLGKPVYYGYFEKFMDVSILIDFLKTYNLEVFLHRNYDKSTYCISLLNDDSFVYLDVDAAGLSISVSTFNNDFLEKLIALIDPFPQQDSSSGKAYVLIQQQNGISTSSVGVAGVKLERENYMPDVIKDFDHIVTDLNSKTPCGRIVVLDGPPGTGKTFLVRSLMDSVKNSIFLVVPSSLVDSLAGPQIMPTLIRLKDGIDGNGSIILIIEDADECLVKRNDGGHLGALSSLLNTSDGILGHMLDIRIIATTNADRMTMDEAVMRPGRLCKRVNIGKLSTEQAKKIYFRLTGKELALEKMYNFSLSEIYRLARQDGWVSPVENTKKLGFRRGGPDIYD